MDGKTTSRASVAREKVADTWSWIAKSVLGLGMFIAASAWPFTRRVGPWVGAAIVVLAALAGLFTGLTSAGSYLYFQGWSDPATTPALTLAIGMAIVVLLVSLAIVLAIGLVALVRHLRLSSQMIQVQADATMRAVKSSAQSKALAQFNEVNRIVAENQEFFVEATNGQVPNEDARYNVMGTILATFEDVYFQRSAYDLLDDEVWEAWVRTMKSVMVHPYPRDHWRESREIYPDSFRRFIDEVEATAGGASNGSRRRRSIRNQERETA